MPKKESFVTLKNGTVIKAANPAKPADLFYDKVLINDTGVNKSDVVLFSNGQFTFGNIGKGHFADRMVDGKINVYNSCTSYTSLPHPIPGNTNTGIYNYAHPKMRHYIQKEGSLDISPLNYRTLRTMIPREAPEYSYLKKYNNTRIVTHIGIACWASFLFVAASNSAAQPSHNKNVHEVSGPLAYSIPALAGGIVFFSTERIVRVFNRRRLVHAINEFNAH